MTKIAVVLVLVVLALGVSGKVKKVKNKVPNSFNVRFKSSASAKNMRAVAAKLRAKGKAAKELRNIGFVTVRGRMSKAELRRLEKSAGVKYVEQDGIATKSCSTYTDDLPWGLDELDAAGSDDQFVIDDAVATSDDLVNVFVLDGGVDKNHPDLQGRAAHFWTGYKNSYGDGDAHGTHCAGTIAGHYHGVCKRAFIQNVRVLGNSGSGRYSTIISAIEAVVAGHQSREAATGYAKSVISMSLGGPKAQAVNDAVDAASAAGVVSVVAAGNSGTDAGSTSPASAPTAITVGAVDSSLTLASFSNYGADVNILAPGAGVRSIQPMSSGGPRGRRRRSAADRVKRAKPTTPPALTDYTPSMELDPPSLTVDEMNTATFSGTSMACPHVAGAIACYLIGHEGAPPTVAEITTWLIGVAKVGVVDLNGRPDSTDSYNLLLQAKQC